MKKANVGVNTAVALVLVMVIFSTRVCGTVAVVGVEGGGMPISGVWSMDPACPAAVIPVHFDPFGSPVSSPKPTGMRLPGIQT